MNRLAVLLEQVCARHGLTPFELVAKYSKNPIVIHARIELLILAQRELGLSRGEVARELKVSRASLGYWEKKDEAPVGLAPDELGYDQHGRPVKKE